jgi:alpha-galactosidase
MSEDIGPSWSSIASILNENTFWLDHVNFWGHNDADMLEVGNGDLTIEENRSHFAFWAAMKSPLIIGTDLSVISSDHLNILKNKYLLAFSQDEVFGTPATPYKWGTNPNWTFNNSNPAEYWSGQSTNGVLVLALNTLDRVARRQVKWEEVPELKSAGDSFRVTDIWTGKNLGCVKTGIIQSVGVHDTIGYLVGESCGSHQSPWGRLAQIPQRYFALA